MINKQFIKYYEEQLESVKKSLRFYKRAYELNPNNWVNNKIIYFQKMMTILENKIEIHKLLNY